MKSPQINFIKLPAVNAVSMKQRMDSERISGINMNIPDMLSVIFQRSNQALRIAFRAIQHIVPVKQVTLVQNLLKMKLETLFFINKRFLCTAAFSLCFCFNSVNASSLNGKVNSTDQQIEAFAKNGTEHESANKTENEPGDSGILSDGVNEELKGFVEKVRKHFWLQFIKYGFVTGFAFGIIVTYIVLSKKSTARKGITKGGLK